MAIEITNNGSAIRIKYDALNIINVPKATMHMELTNDKVWINYYELPREIILDWRDVDVPLVTSGVELYNVLDAMQYTAGSPAAVEQFVATAGQTTFTPVTMPNSGTQVEISGTIYSVGTGISVVGADVILDAACIGGEIVIIRTW